MAITFSKSFFVILLAAFCTLHPSAATDEQYYYVGIGGEAFHTAKDYETLGVAFNAEQSVIKKAYRKLSLLHHPDKPDGNEETFKKISGAYKRIEESEFRGLTKIANPSFGRTPQRTPQPAYSWRNPRAAPPTYSWGETDYEERAQREAKKAEAERAQKEAEAKAQAEIDAILKEADEIFLIHAEPPTNLNTFLNGYTISGATLFLLAGYLVHLDRKWIEETVTRKTNLSWPDYIKENIKDPKKNPVIKSLIVGFLTGSALLAFLFGNRTS